MIDGELYQTFTSVENLPGLNSRAVFQVNSAGVFREAGDIAPQPCPGGKVMYMPWGADNMMPYDILDLIERDETLTTCQTVNAETLYAAGLHYDASAADERVRDEVGAFALDNNLISLTMGMCSDMKYFGFAIAVLILSRDGTKIVRIKRKEACYCRFTPANTAGRIEQVIYANWRYQTAAMGYEVIELLDPAAPWSDLAERMRRGLRTRKFALLCKIPTPDATYYPIPPYAALFRGKWYNIKQLIGIAKEAKLRNSAPIKYQIQVSAKYWESIFRAEAITDRRKQQERVVEEKRKIIDFLTGAENSGKAYFSTFYITPDGREQTEVKITKIETTKEGGDWQTDIQEAINMFCFAMRVHSNLVGSVPGKSQSNNSGSDKRELYTIAQAMQQPYMDMLLTPHNIIVRYNGWKGVVPRWPMLQLTTLDEHKDSTLIDTQRYETD